MPKASLPSLFFTDLVVFPAVCHALSSIHFLSSITILGEVLSPTLWCVHWSWLEAAVPGMGQSWPLHTQATMQSPGANILPPPPAAPLQKFLSRAFRNVRRDSEWSGEMLLFKSTLTLADGVHAWRWSAGNLKQFSFPAWLVTSNEALAFRKVEQLLKPVKPFFCQYYEVPIYREIPGPESTNQRSDLSNGVLLVFWIFLFLFCVFCSSHVLALLLAMKGSATWDCMSSFPH